MKRFAALALTVALLLSTFALAVVGRGYPEWDGASEPDEAFCASFDGANIALSFDPAQDYSNVADGLIQACFFAYDEAEEHYLELYLLFPDGARAGDVFASADGSGSSVALYETAIADEDFYCADERGSDDSHFELRIESAEVSADSISVRGSLSAALVQYDLDDRPMRGGMNIEGARFSFTLPLGGNSFAPAPTPEVGEDEPQATFPAPPDEGEEESPFALPTLPDQPSVGDRPAFTLPPDYAEI